MFEAAVDRFGRAIGGVGVVEVGEDVPGSAFEQHLHPQMRRAQKLRACFEARTLPVNLKIYASYSLLRNQFNETFF